MLTDLEQLQVAWLFVCHLKYSGLAEDTWAMSHGGKERLLMGSHPAESRVLTHCSPTEEC